PNEPFIRQTVRSQCLCGFCEFVLRKSDGWLTGFKVSESPMFMRLLTVLTAVTLGIGRRWLPDAPCSTPSCYPSRSARFVALRRTDARNGTAYGHQTPRPRPRGRPRLTLTAPASQR